MAKSRCSGHCFPGNSGCRTDFPNLILPWDDTSETPITTISDIDKASFKSHFLAFWVPSQSLLTFPLVALHHWFLARLIISLDLEEESSCRKPEPLFSNLGDLFSHKRPQKVVNWAQIKPSSSPLSVLISLWKMDENLKLFSLTFVLSKWLKKSLLCFPQIFWRRLIWLFSKFASSGRESRKSRQTMKFKSKSFLSVLLSAAFCSVRRIAVRCCKAEIRATQEIKTFHCADDKERPKFCKLFCHWT